MLIFFFHVTLRYVTFKKSWIRHCALVKSWIRHRARYVTLLLQNPGSATVICEILDPPLCTCEILYPPLCTLLYVTLRYVTFTKSWIRHRARYVTLRYVYKILDPPLSLVKSNPGSANVHL